MEMESSFRVSLLIIILGDESGWGGSGHKDGGVMVTPRTFAPFGVENNLLIRCLILWLLSNEIKERLMAG